jgi:hypothetical protein
MRQSTCQYDQVVERLEQETTINGTAVICFLSPIHSSAELLATKRMSTNGNDLATMYVRSSAVK